MIFLHDGKLNGSLSQNGIEGWLKGKLNRNYVQPAGLVLLGPLRVPMSVVGVFYFSFFIFGKISILRKRRRIRETQQRVNKNKEASKGKMLKKHQNRGRKNRDPKTASHKRTNYNHLLSDL